MHHGENIHDYESYLLNLAKCQTKEVNINVKNLTFVFVHQFSIQVFLIMGLSNLLTR